MPFGLKNALMVYQRVIDNALWGFVQPKGGWRAFADRIQAAEGPVDKSRQLRNAASSHWSTNPQNVRTKFDAAHEDSVSADPVSQLNNSPDADMFTTSEADTSTLVPVFDRRSFVDDICFGGKHLTNVWQHWTNCLVVLRNAESVSASPRVFLHSHESISCPTISHGTVYTRYSTLDWIYKSKSLFGRASQFAVLLSPWHLVVQRVKEKDCAFTQLLHATVTNFVDLDDALAPVAPPKQGSPTTRLDPSLLYARIPIYHDGVVVSCDGSAKTPKFGGYDSCSWIVWRLPDWKIVIAANTYLGTTTVNLAEYTGMNNGVLATLELGADNLIIVGHSRLAIQQSLGVIACRKESLMTMLNRHRELTARLRSVKYLHVVRDYNAAADSLAGEALEAKVSKVVLSEERKKELSGLNRIQEVIYESSAEEQKVNQPESRNLVQIVNGNTSWPRKTFADFVQDEPVVISVMTRYQKKSRRRRVRFADVRPSGSNEGLAEYDSHPGNSSKDNEAIQTSPDNSSEESQTLPTIPNAEDIDPVAVQNERRRRIAKAQEEEVKWANLKTVLRGNSAKLGYKNSTRRLETEIALRLVVPTTMIQEVLQNCHDSLEGGHQDVVHTYQRVKLDYFGVGLYADVEKHVRSCPDCSSSKSRLHLRGHSPGNILAELPFQLVSMDFVIPLPTTRRGNSALLLFQCAFTGFVIAKAMFNTDALRVAQAFEECVYRRFSAPSLIRHDRDPRFMSEVFQAFAEMMQSKSRTTLSYRPQANGQQERSVKTVIQSVRVYAEDPLQQDWDEIVERLVFAINTSMDTTRRETPFYLVHGWDARSTLRAMTSSLRRETAKQSDALAWRREVK
ncbi:unnamed protein product [Phytophthora fragariaefolia]|uniref:Unnamed protein product n=1 Tax=Phytophthora fragariaefolia TaxID=1490495 RepID=A0A9W7D453_9STRA|nr:unnamed protein product [Phytophthora fragariaefolia]